MVSSGTERIFSAVLDVEKPIFVFVLFVDLPNTGTIKHRYHTNILNNLNYIFLTQSNLQKNKEIDSGMIDTTSEIVSN